MKKLIDSAGTTFARKGKLDVINVHLIKNSEEISIIRSIPADSQQEIVDIVISKFPKHAKIVDKMALFAIYDGEIISSGYFSSNTGLSNKIPVRLPLKMHMMEFGKAKPPSNHKRNADATLARLAYLRDIEGSPPGLIDTKYIYGRVLVEVPDQWHEIEISGPKVPLYYAKMIMHLLTTQEFDYSLTVRTWKIWCKNDTVVAYIERLFETYMDNWHAEIPSEDF